MYIYIYIYTNNKCMFFRNEYVHAYIHSLSACMYRHECRNYDYMNAFAYMYVCMTVCIRKTHMHMRIQEAPTYLPFVCMYVCVCICMYVFMYVYVYIPFYRAS